MHFECVHRPQTHAVVSPHARSFSVQFCLSILFIHTFIYPLLVFFFNFIFLSFLSVHCERVAFSIPFVMEWIKISSFSLKGILIIDFCMYILTLLFPARSRLDRGLLSPGAKIVKMAQ